MNQANVIIVIIIERGSTLNQFDFLRLLDFEAGGGVW